MDASLPRIADDCRLIYLARVRRFCRNVRIVQLPKLPFRRSVEVLQLRD